MLCCVFASLPVLVVCFLLLCCCCAVPCGPAACRAVLRPSAWVSLCGAWLAALLCGAGCCAALLALGALHACAVPRGAVLPYGAVMSCLAALCGLLLVFVCVPLL